MKEQYVAEDGKVFDTKAECLNHEKRVSLVKAGAMWCNGEYKPCPIDAATFIYVPDIKTNDKIADVLSVFGVMFPAGVGYFFYDHILGFTRADDYMQTLYDEIHHVERGILALNDLKLKKLKEEI